MLHQKEKTTHMISKELVFKILDDRGSFPCGDALFILTEKLQLQNIEYSEYQEIRSYINEYFESKKKR